MSSIPTTRSRKHMQDLGYHVETVEHYNGWTKRRNDLFELFDLLCIHKETGEVVGVQTTSASNIASRITKLTNHDNLPLIRRAGWTITVHGWKRLPNGRYSLREEDLS